MGTPTLLVGALPGRAADLTSTPPTATTGRSAPRRSIGKLHFGNYLHQVRARGKLPRSTPPHLAAAFLLPQPHSHITAGRCTSSTRCHRAAAAGLSIFNHPLLGAARARLRRQAALAGRSCAARLRAIKYWSARPTGAQPASRDLCARIALARVCDSHTERHSERSGTLMISL